MQETEKTHIIDLKILFLAFEFLTREINGKLTAQGCVNIFFLFKMRAPSSLLPPTQSGVAFDRLDPGMVVDQIIEEVGPPK